MTLTRGHHQEQTATARRDNLCVDRLRISPFVSGPFHFEWTWEAKHVLLGDDSPPTIRSTLASRRFIFRPQKVKVPPASPPCVSRISLPGPVLDSKNGSSIVVSPSFTRQCGPPLETIDPSPRDPLRIPSALLESVRLSPRDHEQ